MADELELTILYPGPTHDDMAPVAGTAPADLMNAGFPVAGYYFTLVAWVRLLLYKKKIWKVNIGWSYVILAYCILDASKNPDVVVKFK